jgi:hypothetical protein
LGPVQISSRRPSFVNEFYVEVTELLVKIIEGRRERERGDGERERDS